MKPRILIIGAGGHARVVATLIRRTGDWEVAGVLDRKSPSAPELIDATRVIGCLEDGPRLLKEGVRHAAMAVGDNHERAALFGRFSDMGFAFPALRHPTSIVEDNVELGAGAIICAGAMLCAMVRIGRGVIVNTGAILDHETVVGDFAHIAPGCRLAGRIRVGEAAFVGIGTSVRDKIVIGKGSVVGAGSVVVADIADDVTAYGNPARVAPPRT